MVNELKQSEVAIELEKEEEDENDCGKKWRGSERGELGGERGRWSEEGGERGAVRGSKRRGGKGNLRKGGRNGGNPERRKNMLKEYRSVVLEGNGVDSKLEEGEISEVRSERTSLRVGDRNDTGRRDSKAEEDGAEGQGSNGEGKKVDHKALARKGGKGGSGTGYRAIGIRGCNKKAKEEGVEGEGSNGEIVEVELEKRADHKVLPRKGEYGGSGRAYRANGIRGQDNEAKEEGVEGEGSNGEIVEVELEKKLHHMVAPRKGEKRGFEGAYRANGIRGQDNETKVEGVEGEGSNGETVEVELDKKVDHKVLPRKGVYRGFWRNRANGIQGRDNKATEGGVEGEGSNGEMVEVEIDKKVAHEVLPRKGENRGFERNRANGIHGRDNKATEDGVEGGSSNDDKVAVEIVKTVYPKVLPRNGQNGSFGRGYLANGNRRGDFGRGYLANGNRRGGFGRGGRHTRPDIFDDCRMPWRERGKPVWVKKEDKLDA